MKYFAMINGQRVGPLELWELPHAGVGPDTYIWYKGLSDWQKAGDDAEICRMMRRRLAGVPYWPEPEQPLQPENPSDEAAANYPFMSRPYLPPDIDPLPPPGAFNPDTSRPPTPMILMALLTTLFCFPPTGIAAIYFAWRSRQTWNEAIQTHNSGVKQDTRGEELRQQAHEYARMAKMWTGITFFLGLIFMAFLMMIK
ncbi:MAG: CD225/dispanin family protein [Muribaculaceae bacterium]|nr:CD225/dispanin family protein [Muribaculaceae bacterium]